VAVPIPVETAGTLNRALESYRRRFTNARWLGQEMLHVTLVFLGGVDADRVAEVRRQLARIAQQGLRFEVVTGAGGGRIRGRDGVAWISVANGAREILALGSSFATSLPAEVTGSRLSPRRSPAAHITVARKVDQPLIDALRRQQHGPLRVAWTADRICLFRSYTGPGGSVYEVLEEAMLAPG
jgi:2'-5' RNA ligase